MADIVEVMKKAGLSAVEASKPVNVFFGNVVSASPLKINVEQKITLEAPQLILARNVTTHTIQMTVDHFTEDEKGCASDSTEHKHAYTGRKTFLVHKGLVAGDKVILIREQGGQRFVVIDRVGVTA